MTLLCTMLLMKLARKLRELSMKRIREHALSHARTGSPLVRAESDKRKMLIP